MRRAALSMLLSSMLLSSMLGACAGPSVPQDYQCASDKEKSCPPGQLCETLSNLCRAPSRVRTSLPLGSGGDVPPSSAPLLHLSLEGRPTPQPGYELYATVKSLCLTWGGYSEFEGSIFAVPGVIQRVTDGCADGSGKAGVGINHVQVNADRTRIDFVAFPPYPQRGGIELFVSAGALLGVDLLVEGSRATSEVYFSSADTVPIDQMVNPSAIPFQAKFGR